MGERRHFVCVSGDSPFRNTQQSQGQSTRVNRLKICVYYVCVCVGSDDGSAVCDHKPITGAVTVVGLGSRSLKHEGGGAGESTTVTRKEKESH